jgi:hypothetical protein
VSLCRLSLVVLVSLAAAAAEPPAEDKKKPEAPPAGKEPRTRAVLEENQNLPGPFHAFNVTGPRKGNFHCVVSGQGLDPLVLLFVRDLDFSDPAKEFKELLRRLDGACVKNPSVRLACAVVFLSEDLKEKDTVVTCDDKREDLAGKLEALADELKLQKVVLCLDDKYDVEKYDLERGEAAYTLVLARKAKIVAAESIPRDKLTPEKVAAIVKLLADKLGAVRK